MQTHNKLFQSVNILVNLNFYSDNQHFLNVKYSYKFPKCLKYSKNGCGDRSESSANHSVSYYIYLPIHIGFFDTHGSVRRNIRALVVYTTWSYYYK